MTETAPSTTPSTTVMKAVVRNEFGSADALQLREVARPSPADDELLVRVRAASVGAWDWRDMYGKPYVMRLMGMGLRGPKKPILGLDMAGEVVTTGANVTRFKPGDSVYGECTATFAEYTLAKEDDLARTPAGLSFVEAASMPIAGVTALLGLREQAQVQPGESVLIVGATGGVGVFAVQIAKAMGAEVTAVCRAESAEAVASLGADHVIDYTREDFTTRSERYDVIFQIAGSASARSCRRVLAPSGRLVLCSGDGGGQLIGPLFRMARAMLASPFVSQKTRIYVAKAGTENLGDLTRLVERGDVVPVIDRVYPLTEAADALRRFEDGRGPGKIVLEV